MQNGRREALSSSLLFAFLIFNFAFFRASRPSVNDSAFRQIPRNFPLKIMGTPVAIAGHERPCANLRSRRGVVPGMRSFLRVIVASLSLTFVLSGCVTQQQSNTTGSNSTSNTGPTPQAQSVKVSAEADDPGLPVTLPVLDAFFADEAFAPALKAKLQLTDEQVERLRQLAREETAK